MKIDILKLIFNIYSLFLNIVILYHIDAIFDCYGLFGKGIIFKPIYNILLEDPL